MYTTSVILVHSDRRRSLGIEHTTAAFRQVLDVVDITLEKALVLCIDLEILSGHAWEI